MTKNKKKLRRAERRYSLSRSAQTLVLTGLLLAGGVGTALAANTDVVDLAAWNTAINTGVSAADTVTVKGSTADAAITTNTAKNILGGVIIEGVTGNSATLTLGANFGLGTTLEIKGVTSKEGTLNTGAFTFTAGGATTVGTYGNLVVAANGTYIAGDTITVGAADSAKLDVKAGGTVVGNVATTGAKADIDLYGTIKGNVSLAGTTTADSKLVAKADTAQIWGNVTVTKGTLSTTSNDLTIKGADGTGLGNVILGATDSALTLNTTKTLTLGTLTVNKDTAIAGNISFAALDGDKKLTLNTGGAITVQDANKKTLNMTLNSTGSTGLVLGNGGSLTASELSLKGFSNTNAVTGTGGALSLAVNKLILDEATTFGADAANKATTVTIFTKTGTHTDFINKDITIKGYASNVGTLNLGNTGNTGTGSTTNNITLAGTALSTDAVMNVGYSTFGVGTINVGSATDVTGGGSGTITVNNGGTLNATAVNLFGLTGQAAKLVLEATASNSQTANIGTLTVGGANTFGDVSITGTSGKLSTLSVNSLAIGNNGKVNVNAFGVLDIKGSYTTDQTKLAATAVAGGIGVAANATVNVKDTLTITNGGNDVSAGVTATTGTVMADAVKAGTAGDKKLTWTLGNLNLLGDGKGTFLQASELVVTGGTVNLGFGGPDTSGGTFANKVTVDGGKLHVNKGEWTLSNTTNGLTVSTANGVEVVGGVLNVAKWDSKTTSAGTATVQGGTLNLTGTTAGSVQTSTITDITASAGGVVTANASAVLKSDWTDIETAHINKFTVNDTGWLKISSAAKDLDIAAYNVLKGQLMAGTGTLELTNVTIKGVNDTTNIVTVDGVSVANNIIAVADNNKIDNFGTAVKGLKGAGTANIGLTVSGGLTIVGGTNADFKLSDNGTHNTNITVSTAGGMLNLGSAASAFSYGTLKGGVALNNATANLNATKGTFVIDGDITATADGNGVVFANGANLTANSIGTSALEINTIKTTNGFVESKADAFVQNTNLDGKGGLKAANITQTTGTATLKNNATMWATTKMELASVNIKDGGNLIAGGEMTITAFNNGTADNVSNANISATTKLTLTDKMVADKVSIRTGELVANASISAKNSDIQAGKMTLNAELTLTEGTTMNVGDFTGGGGGAQHVTVGGTNDKTGSSLIIGKLTSGANKTTFFVDPIADNSLVQVKSLAAAGTSDLFIAANNGIVSFGEHGMDWAKTQMAESGIAPTAAVVLSMPTKLNSAGQLLVGKDFDADGKWQNGAASTKALDVRGKSLIIADVSNLNGKAALSIGTTTNKTANIDSTAGIRLYSNALMGDQSYTLVDGIASTNGMTQGGTVVTSGSSLKLASASTNNMLIGLGNVVYTAGAADTGTLKTSTFVQNAGDVLPKISTSMGSYLESMARTTGFDTTSGNTGIRFVSRALDNRFIGTNDPTLAAATIEGAAQLAAVGATPGMTISAATAATTASNTRTSFATPLMDNTKAVALHQGTDGTLSLDSGLSAGSSMKTGLGVWIMPLYQSNNVWGMEAENFKSGYKSDLGGVVLGADYTIDDSLRFGLAFNLGGGYAQSTGDFNATDNSFNFWGLNLYGGWSQNNFGISGDVGYTSTYNKVKQETPAALQMGDIKSDVTSRAWTAGLRGEYKFATDVVDIIPHVGVRYLGLTSDSYKAKIGGETVFKADEAYQSIWTFPIGVTFAKEITNASGWTFRPQVDLGITPAAGDVHAKSRVRIPNVDGSAEMKMQVMDYMSYDGGLGLEVKKDNVSFGINYNIQASEHRTGHGVFGTLRYEF